MYIVEYPDGTRILYDRTIETYVLWFKMLITLGFVGYLTFG